MPADMAKMKNRRARRSSLRRVKTKKPMARKAAATSRSVITVNQAWKPDKVCVRRSFTTRSFPPDWTV